MRNLFSPSSLLPVQYPDWQKLTKLIGALKLLYIGALQLPLLPHRWEKWKIRGRDVNWALNQRASPINPENYRVKTDKINPIKY